MTIASLKTDARSSEPLAAPSPRGAEPSVVVLVDVAVLRDICDGDAAVAADIVQDFEESAADLVSRAKIAITSRDVAAAMRAAHTLKGSSGILGATALRFRIQDVERAAAAGDLVAAARLLDEVRDLAERTIAILRADVERMSGR